MSPSRLLQLLTLLIFFIKPSHAYPSFQLSSPFECHGFTFQYPFHRSGFYGNPFVNCSPKKTTISSMYNDTYRVLGGTHNTSYNTRTLRIADETFFGCHSLIRHGRLITDEPYTLSQQYKPATLLNCTGDVNYQNVKCFDCTRTNNSCFLAPDRVFNIEKNGICTTYPIIIPVKENNITAHWNIRPFLKRGFDLQWTISDDCLSCEASGGNCYGLYNYPIEACICPHDVHRYNCSDGQAIEGGRKISVPVICGLVFGLVTVMATAAIIVYRLVNDMWKRKELEEVAQELRAYMDPIDTAASPSIHDFLQRGFPQRYTYAQIKRYTNNLAHRIGQGGFGTVFKGELPNGCLVAVKILDKLKHSRKQFMNEVATVGRIHHIHLVRLLGFCFDGSKRALVYEYMVNGSLEKFIHGENQNTLNWKQLYSIAMGTARGIAYLHDECRSRILHCDIKPHNVLLDANFSPKLADFGLAKLADRERSHVSVTSARGTAGYTAPEVWSINHRAVSDRSDVYSYGMLVMEMVGGRKNFDIDVSRSSQFYYPEWAFKQVEKGEFGILRQGKREQQGEKGEDLGKRLSLEDRWCNEEEEDIARKLSMVGLWCIQYNPSHRPTMRKVIQMLEGSIKMSVPPMQDTPSSSTM